MAHKVTAITTIEDVRTQAPLLFAYTKAYSTEDGGPQG